MEFNKRTISTFWAPLLAFWAFLLVLLSTIDNLEFSRSVPFLIYLLVSFCLVYQLQNELLYSSNDTIIKVSQSRSLFISLLVSSIAIVFDLLYYRDQLNIITSIFILAPIAITTFTSGMSGYADDQLSTGFDSRSKERNLSIDIRNSWTLYLQELISTNADKEILDEVHRIQSIVKYSSYFRSDKASQDLDKISSTKANPEILNILKQIP